MQSDTPRGRGSSEDALLRWVAEKRSREVCLISSVEVYLPVYASGIERMFFALRLLGDSGARDALQIVDEADVPESGLRKQMMESLALSMA